MLIIGELINSSRKEVRQMIEAGDKESIQRLARKQEAAGAQYLDVNCGTFIADEPERLCWLVDAVQEVSALPLCLDSPNAAALSAALPRVKNGRALINSISAERERFATILPLALRHEARLIALSMDDGGIPVTAEDRLTVAARLYSEMREAGIAADDIFIDPLVQPIATTALGALPLLNAVRTIRAWADAPHCVLGLSNISFGLPNRALLNRCFLIQAMCAGVDACILNPLDKALMGACYASTALLGEDKFCAGYIKAHRRGFFENSI